MKKALAIISALALVSAAAFAEDAAAIKLSGQIETGARYQKAGSDDATVQLYNDDAGTGSRFDLNGDYVNGDSGLSFKLRSDTGFGAATTPSVYYGYVWSNLFNKLVTVRVGDLNDTDGASIWKTEGDIGISVQSRNAVQVQVKPVAGVNLGVMVNLADSDKTAYTLKQTQNELGFGAGYVSDLFNAHAGYRLSSDAASTTTAAVDNGDNSYGYFDVNYKGTKNLTAKFEAGFYGLGLDKDTDQGSKVNKFDEIIGYQVSDPLYVGILAYQYSYANSDIKTTLNFKPNASYKLDSVTTLNAAFFYELNSLKKDKNGDFYVNGADGNKDINTYYIQPGATFQVGPNAKINSFYKYNVLDSGNKSEQGKLATSTVQIDFIYSF